MNTGEKTCFKCGAEKPLAEFYKHKQMRDGHLNKCKDCTKMDARARRFDPKFRDRVLEYDRSRGNRQGSEYASRRRKECPTADKARCMVGNAVRDGKLSRPERCQHCHQVTKVHGHHEDYERPLEVVWLCVPCHRNLHSLYDTIGRTINKAEG